MRVRPMPESALLIQYIFLWRLEEATQDSPSFLVVFESLKEESSPKKEHRSLCLWHFCFDDLCQIFNYNSFGDFYIATAVQSSNIKPRPLIYLPISTATEDTNTLCCMYSNCLILIPRQIKSTVRLCQRIKNRRRQIQTFDPNNN